jgi:hypothetical protein
MNMAGARPFKIWNQDRSIKKGIVATSLQDLISKGKILFWLIGAVVVMNVQNVW